MSAARVGLALTITASPSLRLAERFRDRHYPPGDEEEPGGETRRADGGGSGTGEVAAGLEPERA